MQPRAVWAWEKGESIPAPERLPKLSKLYRVSTQFILYGIDEPTLALSTLHAEIAHLRLQVTDLARSVEEGLGDLTESVRLLAERDKPAS